MIVRAGRLYILLVCGVLAAAILVRYLDPFVVQALRLIAFDTYQRLSPQQYDPQLPVRVLDIDERSLAVVGQWPWPRTVLADLVRKLSEQGAAAVVFDFTFPEADRTSLEEAAKRLPPEQSTALSAAMAGRLSNDQVFAAALKEAPSVLAIALTGHTGTPVLKPKTGFAVAGDDPKRFIPEFSGAVGNLPILEEAVRRARLDQLDSGSRSGAAAGRAASIVSAIRSCRRWPPRRCASRRAPPPICSRRRTPAARRHSARSPGSITSASAISKFPTDADGGIWLKYRETRPEAFIPAWKLLAGEVARGGDRRPHHPHRHERGGPVRPARHAARYRGARRRDHRADDRARAGRAGR